MTPTNPTVWPTLQAHDARKLIEYSIDTSAWSLAARYGKGENVDHAQPNWPEGSGGIMLGSYQPSAEWFREPGTAGGHVVTADPGALYERVRAHGADVIHRWPKATTVPTIRRPRPRRQSVVVRRLLGESWPS